MKISESVFERKPEQDILAQVNESFKGEQDIVRCVFTDKEVNVATAPRLESGALSQGPFSDILAFRKRDYEDHGQFNAAFIVPTGVGASVGGHAGDATPVLQMMSQVCDKIFTHPNVVNASDLNEQPANALYIEGSILSRFLMGTIGLQEVRKNRILVLVGSHEEDVYEIAAINSVNAARATFGLEVSEIVRFKDCSMRISISDTGRATGSVENVSEIVEILQSRDDYDAVAITSVIQTDPVIRDEYYQGDGDYANPWGGIEALLTHWISSMCNMPAAHAPMMESMEVESIDYGVVDPRMAAEIISISYLQCVLKGLQRAPRPVTDLSRPGILTASQVNALVIPAGCYGLPIVAALRQGIPVIAVRDKVNSYTCEALVRELPWLPGQYIEAENYSEATGYLAALRAGLSLESVTRPIRKSPTKNFGVETEHPVKRMIHSAAELEAMASLEDAKSVSVADRQEES